MKQANGNWVSGDDFYNRDEEMGLFRRKIDDGANLLIIAQRRMGKTSFLQEFKRICDANDSYKCLFVDLEDCTSAPDAIAAIAVEIHAKRNVWQKGSHALRSVFGRLEEISVSEIGIKIRSDMNAGNWKQKGDHLLAELAEEEKGVVLMLDELPILVNHILKPRSADSDDNAQRLGAADEFMSWIRRNALKFQNKIRFVLCGSIGLSPVLNSAGLSATVNNFITFSLGPWSAETAKGCLNELADHYDLTYQENATDLVVELLGCCIPHHVQVFFRYLEESARRAKVSVITNEMVEHVFKEELLTTHGQQDIVHYEERLRIVLSTEQYPLAIDLLSEAALKPPLTREKIQALAQDNRVGADGIRSVIGVLEHDGYLRVLDGGYGFVSTLLEKWWAKRYLNTYTPLHQRGA